MSMIFRRYTFSANKTTNLGAPYNNSGVIRDNHYFAIEIK